MVGLGRTAKMFRGGGRATRRMISWSSFDGVTICKLTIPMKLE